MDTTRLERTTASLEDVSVDTMMTSVISKVERISSLKEEQRTALMVFIDGNNVFALLPASFSSVSGSDWLKFFERACPFPNSLYRCLPRWFCVTNHLLCQG